eukprot:TRINITY_DN102329_c0_g1_i1.p1 TRINITY_DN102329_c0_g1~~TRINITY_DN102329_c0_g1_i1.p1  ORF type:complete len:500 (-),score=75.74 TRINITY_DN102329_c0_g1_i1:79-1578(-)
MGFRMRAKNAPVALGIDLGTSCCRVGLWRDGDVLVVPNDRGSLATPTCVAFLEHTSPVVGDLALEQATRDLDTCIFAPQRLLGASFGSPWVQRQLAAGPPRLEKGEDGTVLYRIQDRGKQRLVRPEEVVTILLAHLRKEVERSLCLTVRGAVITVPAQYGPQQRKALEEACREAQLSLLALVKAPTAAAIAYSLTTPRKEPRNMLVLDFGASFCDFCLLNLHDLTITETVVGSELVDLDAVLVRFCLVDIRLRYGIDLAHNWDAMYQLTRACESAKKKLSQFTQTRVEVDNLFHGEDYRVQMSRAYFDELCSREIDELIDLFDWCIKDCNLDRNKVDVLLVGGSSRNPRFRRLMRDFFWGRAPGEVVRPDHAAVLGAAVYAASCTNASPCDPTALPSRKDPEDDQEDDFSVESEAGIQSTSFSHPDEKYSFSGLRVVEVMPWSSKPDRIDKPARKEEVASDGEADFPLEEVPCNEGFGCPRPPRGLASSTPSGRSLVSD